MSMSKFFVSEHHAKRARLHWDIRIKKPGENIWVCFACRKTPPTAAGTKIMAVRTHDHSTEEALFTGTIESGYGAGVLKKWDGGSCEIVKMKLGSHITIDFKGRKLKGIYHFISTKVLSKGVHDPKAKQETYMFFKGKST